MSHRDSDNFAYVEIPGHDEQDVTKRPPSTIGWLGMPRPIAPVLLGLAILCGLAAAVAIAG